MNVTTWKVSSAATGPTETQLLYCACSTSHINSLNTSNGAAVLKTIDPLIGPELLVALARMGHGDTIAVVDNNYPAYSAGVPVIRLDGVDVVEALQAILTLFPVDHFVSTPIARMAVVDDEESVPEVAVQAVSLIESVEQRPVGVEVVERTAFYDRAKAVSAVVATGESRPYGCFILIKGVVTADGPQQRQP